ncbi:MAG: efflux transporter outer membrane subunit [Planctomycetes bacterium]|nr:efflux transporter outer membrane subunit [Planctomycetota bacterium]MBI3846616.1 efflux transporter outer membrane subunit [Planctomycetota bacterium]
MNQSRRFASAIRTSGSAILPASLALFATSCRVGPDYRPPSLDVPAGYKSAGADAAASHLAVDWWTFFNDAGLTALEAAALANNQDLRAAASRVVQARAVTQGVASQFYPVVTFDPSFTRSRSSANRAPGGGSASRSMTFNTVQIPFDLSYEIDVWGRVRRAVESATATAQASADDFGVVQQTLAADVAQNYFTLRALDTQDEILTRSVELFQKQVDLTQTQYRAGIAGQTDVFQAKTQLETAIALESDVRRQRADTEHALAILTGQPPSALSVATHPLDGEPPAIPAGLPADLLRQRPDVAEAEQNLIAANASIGVATADFYPTLRLSGSAGFESVGTDHALDWESRVWSFGPSVSLPIFEGGKLSAGLEQAKARYDEVLATYRQAVLVAFRDVEDALTDLHFRAEAGAAEQRAVDSARESLRLADLQYRQGLVGYLQVIDAERTLLTNELASVQIQSQRFVSTVLLIKALGGGWAAGIDPAPEPAVGPKP